MGIRDDNSPIIVDWVESVVEQSSVRFEIDPNG